MNKRIFLSPPWVGEPERAAVAAAFDSGYVAPCGPLVDTFDQRLGALAGQSAAAVASGTAALDLLMAALDVGPDTTVIASSLTFIAAGGPAARRGAAPVCVDAAPATGALATPLLEKALKTFRRTHAKSAKNVHDLVVISADIYGQCCDYDAIASLCDQYEATYIVDAAEAVGATYRGRPAGHAGLAAIYSFNGNKLITTSGGGAVLARNPEIVARARWRAQQSRENAVWYEHREVGNNYRMSNILAAVGCAQLDRMPEIIRRKSRTFSFYSELFARHEALGIVPFPCGDFTESTRWLSVFLYPTEAERDAAAARLTAANIESRPVWKPMHLQPVFKRCRAYGGAVSEDFFRRGICLPSGAGLTKRQLDVIAHALIP